MKWQREEVLALAPDSASVKAAQKLTSVVKWPTLGCNSAVALWGECQGSGKTPYRTAIDLAELAFKCSCPSRKFPCKHALALFLLYVQSETSFHVGAAIPDWVQSWLDGRTRRKNKQPASPDTAGAVVSYADSTPAVNKQDKAQARRSAARAEKVANGIAELTIWLKDLVRSGYIDVQSRPYSYWQQMAARLIDAQAPGLASQVEELGHIVASGGDWAERLTKALGKLFLLLEAYQRIETLPEPLQQDIRTLIGWHQSKEEVLAGVPVTGNWQVMSHDLTQEDNLISQRVWLQRIVDGQHALILNFAHPSNRHSLDTFWRPGSTVQATIFYYGGSVPMRALATDVVTQSIMTDISHLHSVSTALGMYQQGVAQNPWLTRYPLSLGHVTVGLQRPGLADGAFVYDREQRMLPLSSQCKVLWQLLSISGGCPIQLFGEWLDDGLLPLGLWHEGRYWTI